MEAFMQNIALRILKGERITIVFDTLLYERTKPMMSLGLRPKVVSSDVYTKINIISKMNDCFWELANNPGKFTLETSKGTFKCELVWPEEDDEASIIIH